MTAPVNLKEQLRAEAFSRVGFTVVHERVLINELFDKIWAAGIADGATLMEQRDNALDSLRLCREELRLARLEYGALKEAALDCAGKLEQALKLL